MNTTQKKWMVVSIFLMLLIFFFSSQNGEDSSKTSGFFTSIFLTIFPFIEKDSASFIIRKCAHFTIFGCLGFSLYHAIDKRNILYSLSLAFLYACFDEFHQSFVSNRSAQFRDVLIDTCGAFCFIGIAILLRKLLKKKA